MRHPVAKSTSEGEGKGLLCHFILLYSITSYFKQVSLPSVKNKQLQNSSTINISSKEVDHYTESTRKNRLNYHSGDKPITPVCIMYKMFT